MDISLKNRIKAINIFNEIYSILYYIGDRYRLLRYLDAIKKIKEKKEDDLSDNFKNKIREISKTGTSKNLKKLLKIKELIRVPGFGKSILLKMYNSHMSTTEYIKKEELTNMQKIGLKYYKHILRNLNRKVVEFISDRIKRVLKIRKLYSKFKVTGSYRRGKEKMGDIDILIVPSKEIDPQNISDKIKKYLKYESISYADTYAQGQKKFSFLVKVKKNVIDKMYPEEVSRGKYKGLVLYAEDEKKNVIKRSEDRKRKFYYIQVDIRYVNGKEYPFALLYFTGSRTFNIIIRRKAIKMGLKLNEYGLADKEGKFIDLKSEKAILDYLGMKKKYYHPKNRKK
jgi:DNA polymerase beta